MQKEKQDLTGILVKGDPSILSGITMGKIWDGGISSPFSCLLRFSCHAAYSAVPASSMPCYCHRRHRRLSSALRGSPPFLSLGHWRKATVIIQVDQFRAVRRQSKILEGTKSNKTIEPRKFSHAPSSRSCTSRTHPPLAIPLKRRTGHHLAEETSDHRQQYVTA